MCGTHYVAAAIERSPDSVHRSTPMEEVAARAARLQDGEVLHVLVDVKNRTKGGKDEYLLLDAPTLLRDIVVPLGLGVKAGRVVIVVSD